MTTKITANNISANAITTTAILDAAVTSAKLSGELNTTIQSAYDTANTANTSAQSKASTGKAIAMAIVFG